MIRLLRLAEVIFHQPSQMSLVCNLAMHKRQIPIVKTKARFIQPMLLQRTEKLPQGPDWLYEIKFDGYRILAINRLNKRLRYRQSTGYAGDLSKEELFAVLALEAKEENQEKE